MINILLTNDDGISPATIPTINSILHLKEEPYNLDISLRVIIPDRQRSWISKQISIFDELHLEENVKLEGLDHPISTLTGTPADCVNIGVYNFNNKPDFVISGANVGSNVSWGHFLSSGTVGGAMEGLISGIPSLALSCPYTTEKRTTEEFQSALKIFPKLLYKFITHKHEEIKMLSVNIPLTKKSIFYQPITLSKQTYIKLFDETEKNTFKHRPKRLLSHVIEPDIGTDLWAKNHGIPSVLGISRYGIPLAIRTTGRWLAQTKLLHVPKDGEIPDEYRL